MIGSKRGICYFHNLNILNNHIPKNYLIRFYLKYISQNIHYIVQTPYVKSVLLQFLGASPKITVKWPGIYIPLKDKLSQKQYEVIHSLKEAGKRVFCFPVQDLKSKNKNFQLLKDNAEIIRKNNVIVLITSNIEIPMDGRVFKCIGGLSHGQVFELYDYTDGLFFTSIDECLATPIWEFLGTGKPVIALNKAYVTMVSEQFFNNPKNLLLFTPDNLGRVIQKSRNIKVTDNLDQYQRGDWNII